MVAPTAPHWNQLITVQGAVWSDSKSTQAHLLSQNKAHLVQLRKENDEPQ